MTSDELPGQSPLGVVMRDPEPDEVDKILDFAASELGFVTGGFSQDRLNELAAQGEDWEWEDVQLDYLDHDGWYIGNKPRQMGMSAVFAAKATARGILARGNYTGIFASYKKEEAINKINYVKQYLECLPLAFRKEIIRDPLQLIEWRNQNGTISKIISHAQKPIRGHHGDVWLDEFAFFQDDALIFESCLPVISQVGGTIHIGSTPFGKAGMFYDICKDRTRFPEFKKQWIAWWHCKRYLKFTNPDDPDQCEAEWMEACLNAPKYSTEERVYRYGNHKIITQFKNLDTESFRQEFEGLFVDEQAFFFSRALILSTMFDNRSDIYDDYHPLAEDFTIPIEEALANHDFEIEKVYPNVWFRRFENKEDPTSALNALTTAIRNGKVSLNLYAGVDIGITRHSTDIRILEEIRKPQTVAGTNNLQVERFGHNQREWDPDDQYLFMRKMMAMGFIQKMNIDGNGVGLIIAKKLKKEFKGRVNVLMFNHVAKTRNEFMNNLKRRMTAQGLALAYDRNMIEDLHCIRSIINQSKTQRFVTDEKKLSHGDRAWALGFASMAGTPFGQVPRGDGAMHQTKQSVPGWAEANRLSGVNRLEDIESQPSEAKKKILRQLKTNNSSGSFANRMNSSNFSSGPGSYIPNWDE